MENDLQNYTCDVKVHQIQPLKIEAHVVQMIGRWYSDVLHFEQKCASYRICTLYPQCHDE